MNYSISKEKASEKYKVHKSAKSIFAVVLVMLFVMTLFAGCDLSSVLEDIQKPVVEPSGTVASAEYNAVFEGTGIVHFVDVVGTDTVSYAIVDEDGFINCQDYAYKGDIITEWAITDYIPIHGFTEENIANMKDACESDMAMYEGYDCVKATYSIGADYITFSIKFINVDDTDTMKVLQELEMVDDGRGYLSMEECEKIDLSDGYVKK